VTAVMVQVRVWQVKRSTLSSVDRLMYCYGNYLMTSFHQVIYYFIHWIVWLIWRCFVTLCERSTPLCLKGLVIFRQRKDPFEWHTICGITAVMVNV